MRYARQNRILELISQYEIETQEKLSRLLKESGFVVTQATVSRDIKELQLIKVLGTKGRYKYAIGVNNDGPINDRFNKIFRETIVTFNAAGNLVLVKTLPGCGNAAAEAIDSLGIPHTIGSVAGDNTILIVVDDDKNVASVLEYFQKKLD